MDKKYCSYCMSVVEEDQPCPNCGLTEGTYTPSPHHLPPGTVLSNRYMVGRVLGEGGFGITYIGCDLRLELRVAIKEYFPTDKVIRHAMASLDVTSYIGSAAIGYAEGKSRFLNEARAMARMDKQPQIVAVRDFFEEHNTAYIVMEYVDGTTFKELVAQKGGRIPPSELLPMIEPLFAALTAMHAQGLIHRDISPDNLMLENGVVRLLDFGCARESANGTATMTITLKHGYAPVEQYQQKGQGPWTDVYGLSATIYYCLTGKTPPQAMNRLCEDELILPRKLGVPLTEKQEQALLYGMGIRPRRRFQSVEELHAALYGDGSVEIPTEEEAEPVKETTDGTKARASEEKRTEARKDSGRTAPAERRERRQERPKPKKGKLWAIVGGIAAAALVLVLLISLLTRQGRPEGTEPAADYSGDPTAVVTDPENDPFVNAVHFTEGGGEDLRALLEDDSVPAIIVECWIEPLSGETLEIRKPVALGYGLESYAPITVGADGQLRIEGVLSANSLLRTQGGGTIEIASGGEIGGSGRIWLEQESNLILSENAQVRVNGSSPLIFCEETLFADAAHVNSREEYLAAAADDQVSAIVVDSSLFAVDGSFLHEKPVLISEGVIVDGWFANETLLVNRGTISGDLYFNGESGCVLNYGSINGKVSADGGILFLNYGSVATGYTQLHAAIINLGWFIHVDRFVYGMSFLWGSSFLDITCDHFINNGELRIEAAGGLTKFVCNLINTGTITVAQDARLELDNWTVNCGDIAIEAGGELLGVGCIDQALPGASLTADAEAHMNFAGLLIHSYEDSVVDTGGADGFTQLDFAWINSKQTVCQVTNEEELRRALEDETCTLVFVDDVDSVEIHGDLEITKGVAFAVPLTMEGGSLTVSGEQAYVISGETDLKGGSLILKDSAVWVNRYRLDCGSLQVGAGSLFLNQGWLASVADLEISGTVTILNGMELESAQVRILDGGTLRSSGWLGLERCQVDIAQNGMLTSVCGRYRFDPETAVTNRGELQLHGWMWQEQSLEGQVTNSGRMEINGGADGVDMYRDSQAWLRGTLTNYGTLVVYNEYPVSGTLDNQGTLILSGKSARLVPADGGAVTGAPATYE